MSFQARHADAQRFPHGVVAGGIETVERRCGVALYMCRYVDDALACCFCASDFNDQHLVTVGGVVLRCREASQAFIADLGRGRRIGAQVADNDSREKRFVAGHDINDRVLNFPWLLMNLTGDFHA